MASLVLSAKLAYTQTSVGLAQENYAVALAWFLPFAIGFVKIFQDIVG
jgi:hypothetical protein